MWLQEACQWPGLSRSSGYGWSVSRSRPTGAARRPRNKRELRRRFEDCRFEREQIPTGEQARLLVRLLDVYEDEQVFADGCPAPLCQICPKSRTCWADAKDGERRQPSRPYGADDEDGSVMLPWVGRSYEPGGVVVLGISPNIDTKPSEWSELLSEHSITWNRAIPRPQARCQLRFWLPGAAVGCGAA